MCNCICRSLERSAYNHVSATYYLLAERLLRKRDPLKSCSMSKQPATSSAALLSRYCIVILSNAFVYLAFFVNVSTHSHHFSGWSWVSLLSTWQVLTTLFIFIRLSSSVRTWIDLIVVILNCQINNIKALIYSSFIRIKYLYAMHLGIRLNSIIYWCSLFYPLISVLALHFVSLLINEYCIVL